MIDGTVFDLFWTFARLSAVAVGGVNTSISELIRQVVDVHGWMTRSQLADTIALAQASPGPNGLVVSLIGWEVSGLPGFLAATLGISLPPALMAFGMSRIRRRLAKTRFLKAAQAGLVPIVVGLMFASGYVTARATDNNLIEYVMTAIVAVMIWRTNVNPLWLLGAAALIGVSGLASG